METTIQRLLELQDIDTMLRELSRKKSLIPRKLEQHHAELRRAQDEVEKQQSVLKERELERRRLEKEVEEIEDATIRFQNQLNIIKTNEEYRALLAQIDHSKTRQSECEDRILADMEEIEDTEDSLKSAVQALRAAEATFKERELEANGLMEKLQEAIDAKTTSREQVAEEIPEQLMRRYERILAGKDGLAVALIDGQVCSGCHGTIPPQTINEIRKCDRLHTCQHCGRILLLRS
jgi:predicted  nucleic acid-binding Zn-ribbon protein